MHLSRLPRALLLGGILLLALPVAQAKKSDSDGAYRDESSQGRQIRGNARAGDSGAVRIERRGDDHLNDGHRNENRPRYEQHENNYAPRYPQDEHRYDTRPQSRGKSLSEAVSEAEHRTGGRVLSADPREENGELYYRVKVLTPNGSVQILYLDAR